MNDIWLLLVAVFLLIANGFFVAVEFALIASRRTKLESLARAGNFRANLGLKASRELSLQLAGAQLGITMASLGLGAVAEPAIAHLLEDWFHAFGLPDSLLHTVSFIVALTIVIFLHMVIGEMIPKNIAIAEPEQTLLWLAIPNLLYMTMFRPMIRLLNWLANLGVRLMGVEPRDELAMTHTADELSTMLAVSREEGAIEELAHGLLTGVLDLGESNAAGAMVPRDAMRALPRTTTVADAEQVVVTTGHSRLPVMGTDLDDIVGFIHAKDLLTVPVDRRDEPIPAARIRRMLTVNEAMPLDDVLLAMRRARIHVALVVDGEQRTAGIVTLEDVLEDVVGDIRDETDPRPKVRLQKAPKKPTSN